MSRPINIPTSSTLLHIAPHTRLCSLIVMCVSVGVCDVNVRPVSCAAPAWAQPPTEQSTEHWGDADEYSTERRRHLRDCVCVRPPAPHCPPGAPAAQGHSHIATPPGSPPPLILLLDSCLDLMQCELLDIVGVVLMCSLLCYFCK